MNTRLVHRIIQLLLAALLLTGILLLAGGTAAAQTRVQASSYSCSPHPLFRSFDRFDSPYDRFNGTVGNSYNNVLKQVWSAF